MKTILAHDSSFHTDDIFAVATLLLVYPDATVVRSREQAKIDAADIVVDVGFIYDPAKFRFDHHQKEGAGKRDNGIPYASFGLVWKTFGAQLAGGEREAALIDRKLVQAIDAIDNGVAIADDRFQGVRAYSIGDFLYSFLDDTDAGIPEERLYRTFIQCVGIAKELLIREIAKAKTTIAGEDLVEKLYVEATDKRLIELPVEALPWREVLNRHPESLFVFYMRPDSKWGLKTVPDFTKSYGHNRKDLPQAWAGKAGEELQKITGVEDAIFAHNNLFMAAAGSREGILKLANIALNA